VTAPRARKSAPDDFDAYWAEINSRKTETIRGVTIRIPADIPMVIEQRMADLQESSTEEDIAELLSLLFGVGPDAFETWKNAGMGAMEFQVLVIWGMSHTDGNPMTVGEAHEHVVKALAEGKAQSQPNRAERRASSASTGGPSKPRSGRPTASTRKASRA
jgi:ribosomal protein S6E (S10)